MSPPEEFIAFSNAGGREGQYDKFDYTESNPFARGGGPFPGQGELILPRNMRYQLGQRPTHIVHGTFGNHFDGMKREPMQYHIWTGRILPRK